MRLSPIKVRFEKVPPGQIRQKAVLDLSSKTGTYATHAPDPMYFPLYASNKWVEPLDKYLNDASLTDAAWFKYDDIIKAWRDADSVDGKPYGIPYDGEVTVQVYRKDLYDAKGLKPAEPTTSWPPMPRRLNDPANRLRTRLARLRGPRTCTLPVVAQGSAQLGNRRQHRRHPEACARSPGRRPSRSMLRPRCVTGTGPYR